MRHLLRGVLGSVEQGHGALGEVAAVADLSFVVRFDQHRAGQATERGHRAERLAALF